MLEYCGNIVISFVIIVINVLGKLLGCVIIYNWCNVYKENGINGLLLNYKGKV